MTQPGVTALFQVSCLFFPKSWTSPVKLGFKSVCPHLFFTLQTTIIVHLCPHPLFFLGCFEVPSSNAASSYKAPQVDYLFICIKIMLKCRPSIADKLSFCPFFTEFSSLSISVPSRVQKHETHLPEYISERTAAARVVNTASVFILTK